MPSDDLVAMRESVQTYGFTDPVIWTYDGSVLDGWHRYTIANLLGLELDVREYDGDPVQWVIGRNLHRRHLTALQRASCVSAAIGWAGQGHQKRLDRDENTGQFTIPANIASMDEPVSTQADSGQAEQEPLADVNEQTQQQSDRYYQAAEESFTQDERATLADVSERTQQRSDNYEKAGWGLRYGLAQFLAQKRNGGLEIQTHQGRHPESSN